MKIISNPRPLAWKASICHLDYHVYFQGSFTSLEITVRFCGKKYWEDWGFSKRRCWRRVKSSSPSTDFSSWIAWPCRQTQTLQAAETSAVTSRPSVTVPEDDRPTLWRRNYFFLISAHSVYKMWIIQEPNKLALWNKLHFEEKKTESIEHV